MTGASDHTITLLVHRPGRLFAIMAAAALFVGGGILIVLQYGDGISRGWSLLLMVPMVVGFVALMRTGTTRCEVAVGRNGLVVRSIDSSQILGRGREVSYAWSDVRSTRWVGRDATQLRVDFSATPSALIFTGIRRDLEHLATAATQGKS